MDKVPLPARYTDIAFIDRGGFGSVYRARDKHLQREVAVKVARDATDDSPDNESFVREARRAAGLQHPNIVAVYDLAFHNGHLYLTMELAEMTLAAAASSGPLEPTLVAKYVSEAACGLGHAHRLGFIHRDVKPSNLLLDQHGTVKVSDFGITRRMDYTATQAIGTLAYMAPEQTWDLKGLTPAADVFALAVTAYELLTGHMHGGFSTLASGEVPAPSALIPSLSDEVDWALWRATEYDPRERTQSVEHFADELSAALAIGDEQAGDQRGQQRPEIGLPHKEVSRKAVEAESAYAGIRWSGAADERGASRAIRVAVIADGRLEAVLDGVTRDEAVEYVDELRRTTDQARIGFDFGFGVPRWFADERGISDASYAWKLMASLENQFGTAGDWPRDALPPPYWGPNIRTRPQLDDPGMWYRDTERKVEAVTGVRGSSVFQLAGAGSVGGQTARGMPYLRDLCSRGWSIWPFDPPSAHTIVEIFPKAYRPLVVGRAIARDQDQMRDAVTAAIAREIDLSDELVRALEEDQAGMDATLAAWLMWRTAEALPDLSNDPIASVEGRIWLPPDDP